MENFAEIAKAEIYAVVEGQIRVELADNEADKGWQKVEQEQ